MLQLTNIPETLNFAPAFTWIWGKAKTVEEGKIELLQGLVGCKDYIVDTYYKNNNIMHSIISNNDWKEQERTENCICVRFPNLLIQNIVINNIKNFLNPWFKANDVLPTTCEQIYTNDSKKINLLYCIRGDSKWTLNAFAWSIYLAIIRMMAGEEKTTKINFTPINPTYATNESSYYNQHRFDKNNQELLNTIFNNPFPYLIVPPRPYNTTGYNNYLPRHGETGPFNLQNWMIQVKLNPRDYKEHPKNNNYFLKEMTSLYKEIKRKNNALLKKSSTVPSL